MKRRRSLGLLGLGYRGRERAERSEEIKDMREQKRLLREPERVREKVPERGRWIG